uniref:O-methyltransferase C-terminal domain-containing protein n=1 Tax=Brassica campestris TaxID=3711 RepID=M4CU76_BRACM
MKLFDYMGTDERFGKHITQTGVTIAGVKKALEVYEGINLDLTCVVWDKHLLTPNVEHVAGDMFIDVPTGDAMILKNGKVVVTELARKTGDTNANIAFDMDM